MKCAQVLKVWWMLTWRVSIMSLAMVIAGLENLLFAGTFIIMFGPLVTAMILVGAYGKTLHIFPLIRLISRQPIIIPLSKIGYFAQQTIELTPEDYVSSATQNGTPTKYDSPHLDSLPLPTSTLMFGVPGAGLSSSGFDDGNIARGQQGERNFAKALEKEGLIDRHATVWSVALPSVENPRVPEPAFDSDIDCILLTGNIIYLLDIKQYASGDITYYSHERRGERYLYCVDNPTGKYVDIKVGREPLSRNMIMALDRFKKHYPEYIVRAGIIFMPTSRGASTIDNSTRFPGGVQVLTLEDILGHLHEQPDYHLGHEQMIYPLTQIRQLIKN